MELEEGKYRNGIFTEMVPTRAQGDTQYPPFQMTSTPARSRAGGRPRARVSDIRRACSKFEEADVAAILDFRNRHNIAGACVYVVFLAQQKVKSYSKPLYSSILLLLVSARARQTWHQKLFLGCAVQELMM